MSDKKSCTKRSADPGLEMAVRRKARADLLHGDVLSGVLGWALAVSDIFQLSLVCRRWLHAVRSADCWEGHQIDIAYTRLCGNELARWWPIWKLCEFVLLTYSQRDAFTQPCPSPYAIWHKWGRWPSSAACDNWHGIRLGGRRWLVMLTEQRVPDTVGLVQVWSRSTSFKTSLILGWTTATSPRTLSRLWSSREHRRHEFDSELITVKVLQRRILRARGEGDPPPYEVLNVRLDRESGVVALNAFANGYVTLQRPPLGQPVAPQRRLRFFLALPRPVGVDLRRLPTAALQPSDCSVLEV